MTFPDKPCPDCWTEGDWRVRLRPDTPHYAEVRCGNCGRFLKWLAKPVGPISLTEGW